ncbi:hypothetical protein [Hymenobacter sp. IS2118]|uniref:hypothetical protein n=1 Tax=Hymenobacter sp. IS2118 TaxID=1505605 RepID=UPI00054FB71C|nr:hypothetical protein [Hymenobacter sp. IS2118]
MLLARCTAWLLCFSFPALGQHLPPAADTAGYVKGGYHKFTDTFYLGTFTTTDSTTVRAYLPATRLGYERAIDYFETPPGLVPHPKRYTLNIIQVHTMRVHGRYYENLFVEEESIDVLALRLLGGPVELFTYAEPQAVPIPLPLPGAGVLVAGVAYTNTHWYLRRKGQVIKVRRGQFAEQLSAYFADCPALSQAVARGNEHHRFQELPALVEQYNQYLASLQK